MDKTYECKTIKPGIDLFYCNDNLQIIADPYSLREYLKTPEQEGDIKK